MEVHSNPPASQGEETSLLVMVENWSPSEVEEKASYLLENARKVLTKAGSSHEAKLDCICLMAGRLMGFVPIFELEDSLLCPLLGAVMEYLEEVLSMMMETEEENREVFFSLVCTLVEQTEKVVRHCMEQECGVGEVPSLPRVLPKFLINTFSFLGKGEIIATTDLLKAQVANCFSKVRDLLIMFLTLMEKIKMRTVLEDELDILASLCFELVNFHEVLIPLDFKLTCIVWRVYVKLTSTHQARLVDRLNFTMATEVISQELYVQLVKLRQMLDNSLDEGTGKVMAKVMYMLKLLISLGSSPSCVGDSPFFLSLLLEMMSGLPSLPPWLPEAHRQKLEQEVMSVSVMHSLLTMAANQSFISFILNLSTNHSLKQVLFAKPFLSLQLVVQLLLQQPGQEDQLLLLCFLLLSSSSSSMEERGCLEGRQVMGKAMTLVDKYTWVLTNLCSWVSTISQAQFYKVEKVLISVLLDSSSSPLTCMMVSDIWCFLARYGTSQLCLAHLTLLSSILQKVKLTTFSTPTLFITILMERLTNFLSPTDQAIWQSREAKPELDQMPALSSAEAVSCLLLATRTDKDKLAVVVRDTWRKLVEGSYKPSDRLISSRLIMALSKATLGVVDTFSTQDLVSLVENMKKVVVMGQYRQYLLVCLVKVVRVVACRQDKKVSELLAEVVMNNVVKKSVGRQGEGIVGVLAIMAMGEVKGNLGDEMERWRVGHVQWLDIDHVLGGGWSAEYESKMVRMVNCVQEEEEEEDVLTRKVSPTPAGGMSPSFKKRKCSPTKKCLEVCLDNLEREMDTLTSIVEEEEEEVKDKKKRLERISSKLQQVLLRL